MKLIWKKFLLYTGIAIAGGIFLFVIVQTFRAKNTGFETKTLWDWMELLIIPLVLAIGAILINLADKNRDRQIADNRTREDRQLAEDRAKLERDIATDRQQEAALQSYFDRMADLLLKEKLRTTKKTEVRDVARTRTTSVMRGLDARRNNLVIQFLREAGLVNTPESILNRAHMEKVNLQECDLRDVHMQEANLESANLQFCFMASANLQGAQLKDANLEHSYLGSVNLRDAHLLNAKLANVLMFGANLQNAFLFGANLQGASLYETNFQNAHLQDTILQDAILKDAKITKEQLATVKSLKGATMPDGTIHE